MQALEDVLTCEFVGWNCYLSYINSQGGKGSEESKEEKNTIDSKGA